MGQGESVTAAARPRTIRDEILRAQLRPVLALAAAAGAVVVLVVALQYAWLRVHRENALTQIDPTQVQTVLRHATAPQWPVLATWIAGVGLGLEVDAGDGVPAGFARHHDGTLMPLSHVLSIVEHGQRTDPADGRALGPAPPAWLRAIESLPPSGTVSLAAGPIDGMDARATWRVLLLRLDGTRVAAIASPDFEIAPRELASSLGMVFAFIAGGVGSFAAVFLLVFRRRFAVRSAARLSDPVERLAAAVRGAARSGDLSGRVEPQGPVEVAQLAEDFNALQQRLCDALGERDRVITSQRELVASLSHELRTPLAVLRGHAEMLSREAASAASAVVMLRQIEDLHRLLSDLLDLARLESIEATLACEPVPLDEVVHEMVQRFGAAGWRHGVLVRAEGAAPGAVSAVADPRWLRQIAANLLSNAIRYTPPGGLVTVAAGTQGAQARLVVEDSGVGLAAGAGMRDVGGRSAGIGLSVVHRLAAAMGGSLQHESTPEGGTRATVLLARADAAGSAVDAKRTAA